MNNVELKENIISLLNNLSVCIPNSQNTQWVVRCPYCGDSHNPTHGHFSILIDINSDRPMMYRCFKCNTSGILTSEILNDIGCGYNNDINNSLKSYNRNITKNNPYINMKSKKYEVPLNTNNKHDNKKDYLNRRLGLNLSYIDYRDMKIVFDIFEFMKLNEIDSIPNISWKMLNILNENYVGFLSNNNTKITYRCIYDTKNMMRYFKLNIDPFNISPNNFYMIPNSIDLLYTEDMHVHIAEGTFDILSIYYNVRNKDNHNNLYYAACGFNYNTIIRYIVNIGINTNIHLHIYSDKDKSDNNHKYYLNNSLCKIWIDNVYIHRNIYPNEKDFGVPLTNINESFIKIK